MIVVCAFSLLFLFSANLTAASVEENDWSMYRHDVQHMGFVEDFAPSEGNPIWGFEAGDVISSSPAVSDGKVYFASHDGNLYALDAETGERVWSSSIGDWGGFEFPSTGMGDRLLSSPAIKDEKVYVGSWNGKVYAFSAEDGAKIWSYQTGKVGKNGIVFSLSSILEKAYSKLGKLGIYILQLLFFVSATFLLLFLILKRFGVFSRKGLVLLFFVVLFFVLGFLPSIVSTTTQRSENTVFSDTRVDSSPVVADGRVFVGSRDNRVYALDAGSGEEVWTFETGDILTSSPAFWNGNVYFGSRDDKVYSLEAESGDLNWSFKTGDLVHSSPTVKDGTVYVGSRDGTVYALDASSGEKIWGKKMPDVGGRKFVNSSPAIWDNKVYVGCYNYYVYALDSENGSILWDYKTNYRVGYSSPAVADGKVFIGSYDGSYYALDARKGVEIWTFNTIGGEDDPGYVVTSPAISDNTVYVSSSVWELDDSHLYALGSPVDINIENLKLSSSKVSANESVPVEADIKNITESSGRRAVILKVTVPGVLGHALGEEVISKNLYFEPGESKNVEFEFSIGKDGSYKVKLGDLFKGLDVVEKN